MIGSGFQVWRRVLHVIPVLGAVLALSVGATACGDDDESASDAGGTGATGATGAAEVEGATVSDACSLLTGEELGEVGVKATEPQPADSQTGLGCNYGDDPLEGGVAVIVQPGGGEEFFDQHEALLSEPEPLAGLGNQAVLDASNPQQTTVLVLQDDTVLSVGGSISSEEAQLLAEKALSRLGS